MKSCLDHPTGKFESVGIHSQGRRTAYNLFLWQGFQAFEGWFCYSWKRFSVSRAGSRAAWFPAHGSNSLFPALGTGRVTCFSFLGSGCLFSVLESSWMSSHALQRLHVFPRTVAVSCFPRLVPHLFASSSDWFIELFAFSGRKVIALALLNQTITRATPSANQKWN